MNTAVNVKAEICFTRNDWKKFIVSDYVAYSAGEEFPDILSRYINDLQESCGVTQKQIAEAAGMDTSLFTKYKVGRRNPTIYTVILLSIAMRLTPERSMYLLKSVGYTLNDSTEHRIYKLFLQGCAFNDEYSVENCNRMLASYGYVKLDT